MKTTVGDGIAWCMQDEALVQLSEELDSENEKPYIESAISQDSDPIYDFQRCSITRTVSQ